MGSGKDRSRIASSIEGQVRSRRSGVASTIEGQVKSRRSGVLEKYYLKPSGEGSGNTSSELYFTGAGHSKILEDPRQEPKHAKILDIPSWAEFAQLELQPKAACTRRAS